jgi:hypothetical protein
MKNLCDGIYVCYGMECLGRWRVLPPTLRLVSGEDFQGPCREKMHAKNESCDQQRTKRPWYTSNDPPPTDGRHLAKRHNRLEN